MHEGNNLEAHVAACSERYKTIFHRLGNLERSQTRTERIAWGVLVGVVVMLGETLIGKL